VCVPLISPSVFGYTAIRQIIAQKTLTKGMRGHIHVVAAALILAAGLPLSLSAQREAAVDAAGVCARCHETQTARTVETDGHAAELSCDDCHRDRRPGRFGRGHRTIVSCAKHHDMKRHPAHARGQPRSTGNVIRNCITCHEPHGTENLSLVRQTIRARSRLRPVKFDNLSGAAAGGFTDPAALGTGLCEVCHRRTDFYRRNGRGSSHFTESCILCHEHRAGFEVVISEQNCTICHPDKGARFEKTSLHSAEFLCSDCHGELSPEAGAGHRRAPDCGECHTNATHAPPGTEPFPCTQCHDPHGTSNIKLVLDDITTPQGEIRSIAFDSLTGKADGSFASASEPGSGICEVCHTGTAFYRADGKGELHFELSCLPCHRHSAGFNPP